MLDEMIPGGMRVAGGQVTQTVIPDPYAAGARAEFGIADGEPIPLTVALDLVYRLLRMYVHFTNPEQAYAVALWVAHTHAVARMDRSPRLAVIAPTRQSGKTRLLEVIEGLCAHGWLTMEPTAAVLYRNIEAKHPTVLLDEADRLFSKKDEDKAAIIGVLNGGNIRGATVPRVVGVGTKQAVYDFDAYSAVALAGISANWPDTILDRSIIVSLERRKGDEPIEPFRQRQAYPLLHGVRNILSRAMDAVPDDDLIFGEHLYGLSDRQADNWEPLLAIANAATGAWVTDPDTVWAVRARVAARLLSQGHSLTMADDDRDEVKLLNDVMVIFRRKGNEDMTFIGSKDLVTELEAMEDRPWSDWPGGGFTTSKLAKLLRKLGIRPSAPFGSAKRGYGRRDVTDVWDRIGSDV